MRKLIALLAATTLILAACGTAGDSTRAPADARVNAVHRIDRDAGTAALNVSALDDSGNAIEGRIDAVSARLNPQVTGTGLAPLQNLTVTASICQQIVVHGAIHGVMSLDGSGSMSWNDPDEHRADAAKQLVSRLGPTARLAVASFPGTYPDDYTLHQDFTGDKSLLNAAIDEATFAGGGTPLWNSSQQLVNQHLAGSEGNKVLLVLTDGEDGTYGGPDNLIDAATDNNVRVYFVGLGDPSDLDEESMIRVADGTAGLYGRAAESTELTELFNSMLQAATASGEICLTFSPNPVPEGTPVSGVVTLTIGGREYESPFDFTF